MPSYISTVFSDEAHNILSQQSVREQANWKGYRLELFEELIKEGRKFGIFLTLSSQRPADISATIMSQLHNFFIHRLVNDRDLFLLDNTISTLDSVSRSLIPNLSRGSCIITGTSFDLHMLIQVDELSDNSKPDSNDVLLDNLWAAKTEEESARPGISPVWGLPSCQHVLGQKFVSQRRAETPLEKLFQPALTETKMDRNQFRISEY